MAEKKLTLTFSREKETKNKVRFQEDGDADHVGTLYMTKDAAKDLGDPKQVSVEVTPK